MSTPQSKPKGRIIGPAVDTFMAAVPWTKNRTAVVYRRAHAGREYVRIRTFNRHLVKNCWYPTKRFYMIPFEYADFLGRAIIAAARGQHSGPMPDWYADFEKQYKAESWKKTDDKAEPNNNADAEGLLDLDADGDDADWDVDDGER